MKREPGAYPRWITPPFPDSRNLREVAPRWYVGGVDAPLFFQDRPRTLIVDLYGTSRADPARYAVFKDVISAPFDDGKPIPLGVFERIGPHLGVLDRDVLFHCQAGLSRSASVAYGLLRVFEGLEKREAFRRVFVRSPWPREDTIASAEAWVQRAGRSR